MFLKEDNQDIFRYIDDTTGDIYYYNGERMIKIGNTGKKRRTQIGDRPMSQDAIDQFEKEEQNRKKLIDKQNKDAGIEGESQEEYEARLKRIEDAFGDEAMSKELTDETDNIVNKSKRRTLGDNGTYFVYSGGLEAFKVDLKKLLAREFGDVRSPSWSKPDMSYEGTGVFVQGRKRKPKQGKKPVFQIYYDQSGSWGYKDIQIGNDAIAILQEYQKKGLLDVNIFYFGDHVSSTPRDTGGGGTGAGVEVLNHIKATSPDNVIIMTDSDLGNQYGSGGYMTDYPPIKVPGAVWHLFRGSVSKPVQSHIRGKKQTKSYMI